MECFWRGVLLSEALISDIPACKSSVYSNAYPEVGVRLTCRKSGKLVDSE
jgi:hypothetical protein